jgi:DNA invertase Pin-like site-specific DNA recombinase
MKTAIYCRLACADDERMAAQEKEMLRFAEQSGYNDCVCYRDNGQSGATLNRLGFAALMTDIDDGKVACVIVQDISRICRNYLEFDNWLNTMADKGVRLIAVKDLFDCLKALRSKRFTQLLDFLQKEMKETRSDKIKASNAHLKQRKLANRE